MCDESNGSSSSRKPIDGFLLMGHRDEGGAILTAPTFPDDEVNAVLDEIYDDQAISAGDAVVRKDMNQCRERLRDALPAGAYIDARRTIGVDQQRDGSERDTIEYRLVAFLDGSLICSGDGKTWDEALADAMKGWEKRRAEAAVVAGTIRVA